MNIVPVVDMAEFNSGHAERRKHFIKELGDAYHEVGFVTVKNHGISDKLIEELYREVKAFFSLPSEIKWKYEKKENEEGEMRHYCLTCFNKPCLLNRHSLIHHVKKRHDTGKNNFSRDFQ